MTEPELHYLCKPTVSRPVPLAIEFVATQELLADEPACKVLWELVGTQFHTRSKFLAVWAGVRFAALHRNAEGSADGFLLVNTPVNWQIDYVVVAPEARGQGIASALVTETANQAFLRGAPYVLLTSKASLRSLYESCGFVPVNAEPAPLPEGKGEKENAHAHPQFAEGSPPPSLQGGGPGG